MTDIEPLNAIHRSHIREVMQHAKGDLVLASRILGVTTEDLRRLLVRHGLSTDQKVSDPLATLEEE